MSGSSSIDEGPRAKPRNRLANLPSELIHLIFDNLRDNQVAEVSVALSCKRLAMIGVSRPIPLPLEMRYWYKSKETDNWSIHIYNYCEVCDVKISGKDEDTDSRDWKFIRGFYQRFAPLDTSKLFIFDVDPELTQAAPICHKHTIFSRLQALQTSDCPDCQEVFRDDSLPNLHPISQMLNRFAIDGYHFGEARPDDRFYVRQDARQPTEPEDEDLELGLLMDPLTLGHVDFPPQHAFTIFTGAYGEPLMLDLENPGRHPRFEPNTGFSLGGHGGCHIRTGMPML